MASYIHFSDWFNRFTAQLVKLDVRDIATYMYMHRRIGVAAESKNFRIYPNNLTLLVSRL